MRIKKNDNVLVLSGKDSGKSGLVERVFPSEGKIIVKGIAAAKKSVKPSRKNPQGGIIDINQKIDISNAMIICPSCGKPTKISVKVTDKGRNRVCKKCDQSLESAVK